jgi:hypothetical protein
MGDFELTAFQSLLPPKSPKMGDFELTSLQSLLPPKSPKMGDFEQRGLGFDGFNGIDNFLEYMS